MDTRHAFQDPLFSSQRTVRRTLASGTVLELTLEPLPGEQVRVVRYRRKRLGERWMTDEHEAGRVYSWALLGLGEGFERVFGRRKP